MDHYTKTLNPDGTISVVDNLEVATAQLSDYARDLTILQKPVDNYTGAMVSFIDDDGTVDFLQIKAIYDSKGVKCGLSVCTNSVGESPHFNYSDLKSLQNEGFEIYNHSNSHATFSEMTDEQIVSDCVVSTNLFKENGIDTHGVFVYPNAAGKTDSRVKNLLRQYFECGLAVSSTTNGETIPIDSYYVGRYNMQSRTLSNMQSLVDAASLRGAWLIFYHHSWDTVTQTREDLISNLSSIIDYITSKSIPIVTIGDGLDIVGNSIELGDGGNENYVRMSRSGKFESDQTGLIFMPEGQSNANFDKLPNTYKANSLTIQRFSNTPTAPITNASGILKTYRFELSDIFTHQEWIPYNSNVLYTRHATSSTEWGAWGQI